MFELKEFPIHDAEFSHLSLIPEMGGALRVEIQIQIHEDESLHRLSRFGLSGRNCKLVFKNCWFVKSEMLGFMTQGELVDNWSLVAEPKAVVEWKEKGCRVPSELQFHRLSFSGGSVLEIAAQEIAVVNV